MKWHKYANLRTAIPLLLVLLLVGCATQLAPNYDKAIVDGITSTNIKLMTQYASASSGTTNGTYSERKEAYNSLIGNLDALVILVNARPMPDNKVISKFNEYFEKKNVTFIALDDVAPSATALKGISKNIIKMRNTDKKQGVTSGEVKTFKSEAVIWMDQALTYEKFLKR